MVTGEELRAVVNDISLAAGSAQEGMSARAIDLITSAKRKIEKIKGIDLREIVTLLSNAEADFTEGRNRLGKGKLVRACDALLDLAEQTPG